MKIGILGAGQLGRMLALAGYPLGLRFQFLDPASGAPAGDVGHRIAGPYDDREAVGRFLAGVDVVTYEFENVPVTAAEQIAANVPVYPPPRALATAQHRLKEKRLFRSLGIPVPEFAPVSRAADLQAALDQIGCPAVLKTCHGGYDGKGQWVLRSSTDASAVEAEVLRREQDLALKNLATGRQNLTAGSQDLTAGPAGSERGDSSPTPNPAPGPGLSEGGETAAFILEAMVAFDREVSILAARGLNGEIAFYPLVENHHRGGILRLSLAPAPGVDAAEQAALQQEAEKYARRVLEALEYVGVLAIEFFQCGGKLQANEMAPRVHNSGHWTIEGAETSQFENHLRAILGLSLGSTAPRGVSVMLNLIGALPDTAAVLEVPGAHLHLYGKHPRPGRKLGHVTLRAGCAEDLQPGLERLKRLL